MEAKDLIKELTEELATRTSILEYEDDEDLARAEKVQNLKAMVRSGIYDVSSKAVAEKLLKMLF
jgi:anti-sigma28 factor (negative regulator of flagellin synthesis)